MSAPSWAQNKQQEEPKQRPASAQQAQRAQQNLPRAQQTIDLSSLNLQEGDTTTTVAIGKDTYTIGRPHFSNFQ